MAMHCWCDLSLEKNKLRKSEKEIRFMKLPQKGGSRCGVVRYEFTSAPHEMLDCHCTDCQRFTGSQFATLVIVAAADFSHSGDVTSYHWHGSSGAELEQNFCKVCGTAAFGFGPDRDYRVIRARTLDDAGWVSPNFEHWLKSKKNWSQQLDSTDKYLGPH